MRSADERGKLDRRNARFAQGIDQLDLGSGRDRRRFALASLTGADLVDDHARWKRHDLLDLQNDEDA
jgi:hypothetical protein